MKMILMASIAYLVVRIGKKPSRPVLALLIAVSGIISFFSSFFYSWFRHYIMHDLFYNPMPLSYPFYSTMASGVIPELWFSRVYFFNMHLRTYGFYMYTPEPPFLFLFYLSVNLIGILFGAFMALLKSLKLDRWVLCSFYILLFLRLPAFILFIDGTCLYYSNISLLLIFGLLYILLSAGHSGLRIDHRHKRILFWFDYAIILLPLLEFMYDVFDALTRAPIQLLIVMTFIALASWTAIGVILQHTDIRASKKLELGLLSGIFIIATAMVSVRFMMFIIPVWLFLIFHVYVISYGVEYQPKLNLLRHYSYKNSRDESGND